MLTINSECPLSFNCSISSSSFSAKLESFSGVSSTSGDLCFLLWKTGIIPEVKLSEKCVRLEFFEAFTALSEGVFQLHAVLG